ncbi:hypothetical protein [Roseovarius aestuariivivens]|uniref:hypothetical protein n=1 Tax=Roseovarius aestuariivivens TaxID=1888910 RepID=UPI001080C035|nr:hypothetical protein [Roseovarius aestuariivivens]
MLDFLRQNSDLITVVASVAMVPIWMTYLQLFWSSYRRQLRASLIIHPGAGTGMDAQCLISNMSAEAIHVEGIILVLKCGKQRWSTAITAAGGLSEEATTKSGARIVTPHDGPLKSGEFLNIGRFQDLVERTYGKAGENEASPDRMEFDSFEIWVIADYSAEQKLVFARRVFQIAHRDGRWALRAERMTTESVRGKRQRRIKQELQDHLEKALLPWTDET